ncbi:MAG TPA: leucyl aminopeptidase [Nocardioidaceae bacterium]|nr:leucyl aminopeptidase [Nocardioidaceae bacterium]
MTTISLRNASVSSVAADAVVIGVYSTGDTLSIAPGAGGAPDAYGASLLDVLRALGSKGKTGEVHTLPSAGSVKAPLVVAIGMSDGTGTALEDLRRAGGEAARALAGKKVVAVSLPATTDAQVGALAQGLLMGAYGYDRYLTKKHEPVDEFVILTDSARSKGAKQALSDATAVATAVNFARDLVNTPPNDLYPETFADAIVARAKRSRVKVSVTDDQALRQQGYGGIIGVGQGSARPPRLVTMTYKPSRPIAHVAFVGKGITFDSGGLSIKPSNAMVTMKCDMSGAAAVAAATFAIAELGLPVRITAYACLAENMPSGDATRPGDILTMYGGKTVEVLNTDAEGRLVLADGITTAAAQKPDLIVDVATLTGACVVALGDRISGVFSNDEQMHADVPHLADEAGELMWPLPIPEEMHEKVRTTKIADLSQHNPDKWGGALYAAAFLREFVPDGTPWVHLDIAGPAFNEGSPFGYTPKGGTGAAVRTLVALASSRNRAG